MYVAIWIDRPIDWRMGRNLMNNPMGILTEKPKGGTTVEVWMVQTRGEWVGVVPALAGVGARGPDPEAVYAYCRNRTMDIVMIHRNSNKPMPWKAINRKPPVGCKVRRFTYTHGIKNGI